MPRFALLLEYDGAGFVGWQRQENGVSVQQVLEAAAARLVDGAPVASVVAGRTDAGVHAAGQVAHVDLARDWPAETVRDALNFHMQPHRVSVLRAAVVDAAFSARFSAMGRAYRYVILDRRARPALLAGRVWHVERRLELAPMREAAAMLLGRHDFTSFRAAACQAKSPLRTLDALDVARDGDVVVVRAEARSFLHHQVRNMVGTLKLVGAGAWPPARVRAALAAKDRRAAGPTAPPEGLVLTYVRYGRDPFAWPDLELGAASVRRLGGVSSRPRTQEDTPVADLIVIAFPTEAQAEEVRRKVLGMQKDYLIELGDAAIAVKTDDGNVRLNQMFSTTAAGAASGTMWGALIGLLFLNPLIGAALGAASGAVGGALTDVGIEDRFMKDVAGALQPGSAALFLLVRKMTTDKVLDGLRDAGGTVMRTSFDHTKEQALRDALAGVNAHAETAGV